MSGADRSPAGRQVNLQDSLLLLMYSGLYKTFVVIFSGNPILYLWATFFIGSK